jgi:uncharacterized surface protein with fasciclin (FAS1) repeats
MRTTKKITAGLAVAAALTMTAACGASSADTKTASDTMSQSTGASGASMDPTRDLVGPGCAGYAKAVPDGSGSVAGMAADPVAVAAGNNPLLTTLTAAVSGKLNPKVDLVNTLNNGQFTVFAPVDDAFAKLPAKTVKTLGTPAGAETLKTVLTYHVISGQLTPDQIGGTHKTVEGDTVKVTGSGDDLMVTGAHVICGGVHTANATVYLLDSVLMPPM